MQLTNFLLTAAALAPMVSAHGFSAASPLGARSGRSRCANDIPPPKIVDQVSKLISNTADETYGRVALAEAGIHKCKRTIKVPTWIHAAVPSNASASLMSEAQLQKQLDALNTAYLEHDVMFVKAGFTRVESNSISNFEYSSGAEGISGSPNPDIEKYWKEYRTGDYKTLHIWLYDQMSDGLLGIATFPDADRPESEKWLDGIHADGHSVPGGDLSKYNLGITVVHEVGHWLGLFHVFSDEGVCGGQGDMVDDTPEQSEPTYGCPVDGEKDSCPAPGLDSIHNYMDYSDDRCLTEFSEGQENRIHNIWDNIRAKASWNSSN